MSPSFSTSLKAHRFLHTLNPVAGRVRLGPSLLVFSAVYRRHLYSRHQSGFLHAVSGQMELLAGLCSAVWALSFYSAFLPA